jgi:O-acetyl-ADP-ribose deacetylase (regulator of RNase III)
VGNKDEKFNAEGAKKQRRREMKLKLVDYEKELCKAWKEYFKDLPNVEIIHDSFQNIEEYDCMVSPANSFGIMDGGIDLAISRYFGWQLMERVQKRIISEFLGEQPVGTSIIVGTNHKQHPFLAHTPTMRVPMNISYTDNVYLAMWAMLVAVYNHNQITKHQIQTVICPGLGTGYGRVPFREAARQMSLAYKNYLNPPKHIDWRNVSERQKTIRIGGYDGYRLYMDE